MAARILVVEDNPENLKLMVFLLKSYGHIPMVAEDGQKALECARRDQPDLILCDVHMPRVDGYEVARQLKNHPSLRRIPLVAVTALAMVGDKDRVMAAGFDGYLPKPIQPRTFMQQVEPFLPPSLRTVAAPPVASAAPPAAEAAPSGSRPLVLIVDNVPANLKLLQSVLEPSGYRTISASNVAAALEMALSALPDVIVSDLHMPGGSGFDFVQTVKRHQALTGIPFILISSTILYDEDRVHALALGASRFITRPIESKMLLAEIRGCLEERRAPGGQNSGR
jgi:two-component system cell cycle response regulator